MATDSAPPGEVSTELRMKRLFARFVAFGYLAYFLVLASDIANSARTTADWWLPLAVVAVFAPALGLVVAAAPERPHRLGLAVSAAAAGFLLAVSTWPLAWDGREVDIDHGVWLSTIPGLPALAVAIVWPPLPTIGLLATATVGAQLVNAALRVNPPNPLVEIVWSFSFTLLYTCAALMALRTARLLDRTRSSAEATAATASAREAQQVERARIDGLTHDWVMSALLAVGRTPDDPGVVRQAEEAIRQVEQLRSGGLSDAPFDAEAAAAHLRSAAAAVDAQLGVELEVVSESSYPAEVVRAMGAALAEALRNSLRHAGSDADRAVALRVEPRSLTAVVTDDGRGFDPAAVPPERLGVSVGIQGRMRQLPGGAAAVTSAPGRGTSIQLTWQAA
ncbi:sensor histidine kinase [Nocardia sp. NPDC057227]|uniref:sensor histidine kinase n=1 Tax=Nocardia sp. NPDC057227 TaxID=3346056 RepID=UPI00362A0422